MVGSCGMHPYTPSAHHLFLTSQFSAWCFQLFQPCFVGFSCFPCSCQLQAHACVCANAGAAHARSVPLNTSAGPGATAPCGSWYWYSHHLYSQHHYSQHQYSQHQRSHRAAEAFPRSAEFYTITQYLFLFDSRNGVFVSASSPPASKTSRNPTLDFGSFVPNPNLPRLRFPVPPTLGKKGNKWQWGFLLTGNGEAPFYSQVPPPTTSQSPPPSISLAFGRISLEIVCRFPHCNQVLLDFSFPPCRRGGIIRLGLFFLEHYTGAKLTHVLGKR